MGRLRRRATIARNGIAQILETAAEYGFPGEEWCPAGARHPGPRQALRKLERPKTMALGVESLERRQKFSARTSGIACSKQSDSDPLGSENGPHQYTYKATPDPEQDTVIAAEAVASRPGRPSARRRHRCGRNRRRRAGC